MGSRIDIRKYIERRKKEIDLFIKKYLGSQKGHLFKAIRYALFSGGKRLRPILLLATFESLGGKISPTILKVASSLEFIHTFSLIQDDLPSMDNDTYRRGKLTVHKVFGEATALLASDFLLNEAYRLIVEDKVLTAKIKIEILSELTSAVGSEGLICGQQDDLFLKKKSTLGRLNNIYLRKTAALITAAVKLGAILKQVSSRKIKAIARFGKKLGLAYQIQDDILNVYGEKQSLKTKRFSDQRRGKPTYLSLIGLTQSRLTFTKLITLAKREIERAGIKKELLFSLCDFISHRNF